MKSTTKTGKKKKDLFDEFFEIAPQGITILDIETMTFIKNNANACRILKFSSEELRTIGPQNISPEFQPDGSRSEEKIKEIVARVLKGEETVFEWLAINGAGETFMSEVRLVRLSHSKPRLYASFVDITERKEKENRLQAQNKALAEIAFMQCHQVRQPVANILGLISLFDFNNIKKPLNAELLLKVKDATNAFDTIIREIVMKTNLAQNSKHI